MPLKILFTAVSTAIGGRNGHSEAHDGSVKVDLSIPKEMGGPGKPGTTTPEHLFATGYAACFGSALEYVAKTVHHTSVDGASVTSAVSIGTADGGGFGLSVAMTVKIPGKSEAEARKLVEAAHQVCPYSKAIHGNVPVTLTVEV